MTTPGWDIYGRCLSWLNNGGDPPDTDIILFTYNGTLSPTDDEDGLAIYNYLVASGYNVVEVRHQWDLASLPASHYSSFNIAIYQNGFAYDPTNVLASAIPFLTVAIGHTDDMGIGTAISTMHQNRNNFFVLNNSWYPTSSYPLGLLFFSSSMWTDATEAVNAGIPLVIADPVFTPTPTIVPTNTPTITIETTPASIPDLKPAATVCLIFAFSLLWFSTGFLKKT